MITHAAPLPPDFYEKTLRNITNLRQEHEHNDTLHRFLGDAEAAIANLIVLESETRTDRDAARAALGAEPNESTEAAAVRIVKLGLRFAQERDTARGAVQALEATVRRLEANRDEARAERDRALAAALEARNEASAAMRSRDAANFACQLAREQTDDWRTRFDALATRAADLVKERDEARAALNTKPRRCDVYINPQGERVPFPFGKAEPFKVGDFVRWRGLCGKMLALFVAHDGAEFLAVDANGRPHFWPVSEVFQ